MKIKTTHTKDAYTLLTWLAGWLENFVGQKKNRRFVLTPNPLNNEIIDCSRRERDVKEQILVNSHFMSDITW
jgi:hypothetical protein